MFVIVGTVTTILIVSSKGIVGVNQICLCSWFSSLTICFSPVSIVCAVLYLISGGLLNNVNFFRDKNPTPPGGFTNFIQPHMSQNFHFVGGHAQFAPFKPPRTMEDTPSEEEIGTPLSSTERNKYVTVDSGDDLELPRTEKRILWTQEEDVRLVSF